MKKAIYLYSDILGYKSLIDKYEVHELSAILKDAISDINNLLIESIPKNEDSQKPINPFLTKLSQFVESVSYDFSIGKLNYYFAFDTLVIYWEDIDEQLIIYQKQLDLFLNLVSLVYLRLLIKYKILLRGTISITNSYYINDNIFIIKDIEKSYLIEKIQNWGCILISSYELINTPVDPTHPINDTYKRCDVDQVPLKTIEGFSFLDAISNGKLNISIRDLVPEISTSNHFMILNPFNNTTISYITENDMLNQLEECLNIEKLINSTVDLGARIKIENTLKFLNQSLKDYNYHKLPKLIDRIWTDDNKA